MPLFNTTMCRIPGGYTLQATSLLQNIYHNGQAPGATALPLPLQAALLAAILPAVFYWQYRRRRWWQLGLGMICFILAQDAFMRLDRGEIGQTFFAVVVLSGSIYLPLVMLWETSRSLGDVVAGEDMRGHELRAAELLIIAALSISLHLLLFVIVDAFNLLNAEILSRGGDVVNCLFRFSQPLRLELHRDTLNMLLATVPVLAPAMMLAGWLRRRRRRNLATPWQLYVAATPGMVCGGLVVASLLMR